MFTGHAGITAILRSVSGKTGSPAAFIALAVAGYAPDIADMLFLLFGICSPHGLYTHTVPSVVLQAALVGGLAWLLSGSPRLTALFIAAVVLHVPADYLTGYKLLYPGAEHFSGFRLYSYRVLDCLVELPIVFVGWYLMRKHGGGPRWTRSAWILVPAVTLQVLFAYFHNRGGVNLKGSVCFREPPVAAPY